MANPLTGDFDVVAEFAVSAANRVLAAMHQTERFPHSLSLRVDDDPPPGLTLVRPSVAASVDMLGDPVVDHAQIRTTAFPLQVAASSPIYSVLDSVVNPELGEAVIGPIVPSRLKGKAQLQLAVPRMEVPDASGNSIRVRMEIRSRYFPASGTSPLAEFIHGELEMTATVNQSASQTENVVDIDIKAENVNVNFTPFWSSKPLGPEDLAGINLLIRNALKTSFLPSNATLPANTQVRSLQGAQDAVAVLLNLDSTLGNPSSLSSVFLGAGDDFALAVSAEYVRAKVPLDVGQPFNWWKYRITIKSVDLALTDQNKIVVTVSGHAHSNKWYLPSFDFTIHQDFTLKPASTSPGGPLNTVELVPGEISGGFTGWLLNQFGSNNLLNAFTQQTGQDPQEIVRTTFNADTNLGAVLNSVLVSGRQTTVFQQPAGFQLAYSSVEIHSAAIVLHGSLSVLNRPSPKVIGFPGISSSVSSPQPGWPPAHAEFEEIPSSASGVPGGLIPTGPDYTALKSWIPGGTVRRYEWSRPGQAQPYTDENRFVLLHEPLSISEGMPSTTGVSPFSPLCLTVRGDRIAPSGAPILQPVSGGFCGYTSLRLPVNVTAVVGEEPALLALAHPGPRGLVEVAGHTAATLGWSGGSAPNLLVHFGDEQTAGNLGFLMEALRQSDRRDATTAVLPCSVRTS